MDTFELNKIAGAVLFTLLIVLGMRSLAGVIFATHAPETPGYAIEVAEEGGGGEAGGEAKPEVPLPTLLASADADKGQNVSKKCAACHTFDEGGGKKIGPNLYGVVGRDVASWDGFGYSSAMQEKAGTQWDFNALFTFLENPKKAVPGTAMAFAGVKKPEDRADLLLYLRSLAASPAPLPAAEEAAPAEGEKAPADGDKAPAGAEKAPADGEKAPADGKKAPADAEKAPAAGSEKAPAGAEKAPAAGEQQQ